MFRLHANKAKKHTFFRFKARTKIPTFSLIFALSEYEWRTPFQLLLSVSKSLFAFYKNKTHLNIQIELVEDLLLLLLMCLPLLHSLPVAAVPVEGGPVDEGLLPALADAHVEG
jgi:hypothetical protein